jgi:predicted AlkP superfamily pyrophosphatase or phosphodiesterase
MENAFTTLTKPNHWTLATGLWEDEHGIVLNEFFDPARGQTYTSETADASWYLLSEPIWASAEAQGVRAVCVGWLGCDRIKPSYLKNPSQNTSLR